MGREEGCGREGRGRERGREDEGKGGLLRGWGVERVERGRDMRICLAKLDTRARTYTHTWWWGGMERLLKLFVRGIMVSYQHGLYTYTGSENR